MTCPRSRSGSGRDQNQHHSKTLLLCSDDRSILTILHPLVENNSQWINGPKEVLTQPSNVYLGWSLGVEQSGPHFQEGKSDLTISSFVSEEKPQQEKEDHRRAECCLPGWWAINSFPRACSLIGDGEKCMINRNVQTQMCM